MPPASIGPYRLVREIGKGGMGTVFEAVHASIERRVAIKVLHSEYAGNRKLAERFFTEALVVNRIDHPSLVQTSDYGRLPDGTAYIVMEFLKGETLARRLRRGPMTVTTMLQLGWQLAAALAAAHTKGIVHRDLKPANVTAE